MIAAVAHHRNKGRSNGIAKAVDDKVLLGAGKTSDTQQRLFEGFACSPFSRASIAAMAAS